MASSTVAQEHVAYTAAIHIPFCLGCIAVPLPLCGEVSHQRETPTDCSASPPTADVADGHTHKKQSRRDRAERAFEVAHGRSDPRERGRTDSSPENHSSSGKSGGGGGGAGPVSTHAFTHRRYVYVRDGAPIAEDAFYRWLWHATGASSSSNNSSSGNGGAAVPSFSSSSTTASAVGGKRRREAEEEEEEALRDSPDTPPSPSPFYSFIDHVVFIKPRSFPRPITIVRTPPFVIEDLTWAEHPVEVWLHFRPSLGLPPLMAATQVLLEERAPQVLQPLLAAELGKPKPPAVVERREAPTRPLLPLPNSQEGSGEDRDRLVPALAAALAQEGAHVLVTERRDAVRVVHPTWTVLRYYRRVLKKARAGGVVGELRRHFTQRIHTCPQEKQRWGTAAHFRSDRLENAEAALEYFTRTLSLHYVANVLLPQPAPQSGGGDGTPARLALHAPWDLSPFEYAIERNEATRGPLSLSTLRRHREALREERRELMRAIAADTATVKHNAALISAELLAAHQRCLALYDESVEGWF